MPLIADEVICRIGRTGKFWGSLTYGIKPDIVVASKVITGGLFPMGSIVLSPAMSERVAKASAKHDELPTGFTTGGHPVGCAIGLAVLEQLIEGGVFANVERVGPYSRRGSLRWPTTPWSVRLEASASWARLRW